MMHTFSNKFFHTKNVYVIFIIFKVMWLDLEHVMRFVWFENILLTIIFLMSAILVSLMNVEIIIVTFSLHLMDIFFFYGYSSHHHNVGYSCLPRNNGRFVNENVNGFINETTWFRDDDRFFNSLYNVKYVEI